MVDHPGDLDTGLLETMLEVVQGPLVGQVERQVVELHREPVAGHARRLGERLGARPLEERNRVLGPDLEEVVAQRAGRERGHQPHAEHPVVEAHGLVHVGRDHGEVVDPSPPGRFASVHC